jgi:hypothetical protein
LFLLTLLTLSKKKWKVIKLMYLFLSKILKRVGDMLIWHNQVRVKRAVLSVQWKLHYTTKHEKRLIFSSYLGCLYLNVSRLLCARRYMGCLYILKIGAGSYLRQPGCWRNGSYTKIIKWRENTVYRFGIVRKSGRNLCRAINWHHLNCSTGGPSAW